MTRRFDLEIIHDSVIFNGKIGTEPRYEMV